MQNAIFSFVQAQINSQPQPLLPEIMPQENAGAVPGIFDALITEYSLTENQSDIQNEITAQNHSHESSQPVTFINSIFSGRIAEISQPESNPQVTENKSTWQNLFADVRRSPGITPGKQENFSPQNDFDDGITAADSEIIDAPNTDDANFDSHAEIQHEAKTAHEPGNIQTENNAPDYSWNIAEKHEPSAGTGKPGIKAQSSDETNTPNQKLPEKTAGEIPNPSEDSEKPEISQQITPEISRKTQKFPENISREISSPSAQNETPGITRNIETPTLTPDFDTHGQPQELQAKENVMHESAETSQNVTQSRKPSADCETPEITRHIETPTITPDFDTHGQPQELQAKENVMHESAETSQNVTQSRKPSADFETPRITRHIETPTSTPDFDTHEQPQELQAKENVTHESTETSQNVTQSRKPSADFETPETTRNIGTPTLTPDFETPKQPQKLQAENVTTKFTETSQNVTQERKPSAQNETPGQPQELQAKENIAPESTEISQNVTQSRKPSAEIETPGITRESPEISKENDKPKEQPEISGENIIMAGFAAVQPEISQAPENNDSTKNSRAQNIAPRKSQAVTRGNENAVSFADSENPAGDSRIVTPESLRTTQNRSSNSESGVPEQTQPSESHDIGEAPRVRITNQPERNSRTAQRAESRNDTRRTEALNDFQTFFDSVTRVKRSTARVSAQPLNIRAGTYEANNTQAQSRTLRNGIVNTIRFIRSDGVRKANIIVDPPALGRISVELTSSSSGVEASVKVANEQIRQIVQDQFTQLRDNLLQQGVQVSEFTVDVQQDSGRQENGSGGQNQRDAYTFTPSEDDDDTEIFRADLEEGLLYWIA